MKKNLYIAALIVLPVLFISATKYDLTGKLKLALENYHTDYPDEKAYLQTDKTYYHPSESVWYKGFLVNGQDNKPSRTSDVVYVDLVDPWGKVVAQNAHAFQDGTCSGRFIIEETAPGGLYKIKAYTNWMKNQGEENCFVKELTVQKVITPRMLLKLDFAGRAYGSGDEVTANLKITDLSNNKTSGSEVTSTVRIGGVAVQTLTHRSEDGEAAVKFNLPRNLNTTDGILQIVVKDKGIEESITRSIPIVLNKIHITFYPEGGNLVEGVNCKVAFEALNEFGKGADVKGEVVDEQGNKITAFESFHLGMGAFEFTPQAGMTYHANITQPQDCNTRVTLPQPEKQDYVLRLQSDTDKNIRWRIYAPADAGNITLVGHTQKEIYYSEELKLKKGWNELTTNVSDFPMGIAVFTLFDNEKEKCERLVFINPDKGLHIEMKTNKETYFPAEEVALTIKTKDKQGNPVAANLGVAVVDEQLLTMADDKQDNLLSYMLFSSELKGKIEEPYFYFNKEEPKAKEAIDYLMLTHGWRSFVWEEIRKPGKKEMPYKAEKANPIYGYVLDKNKKPVQAEVYLIELGGKRRIGKLKTTPEGHFVFHDVDHTNGVYIATRLPNNVYVLSGVPCIAPRPAPVSDSLASAAYYDDREGIIKAGRPVAETKETGRDYVEYDISPMEPKEQFSDAAVLEEILITDYTPGKSSFTGAAVSTSNYEELHYQAPPLASQLSGAVAGLMVNSSDGNPAGFRAIRIRGVSSQATQGEPLVLIDDVPVNRPFSSAMEFLNPERIVDITVYENAASTAIYGSKAANGVISITTKIPSFNKKRIRGKAHYSGITVAKRRYYDSPDFVQQADNRELENSTVYWNGNVRTGSNGETTVKFKSSKLSSTFRVTSEGISKRSGLMGSETKRIVTQKPFSLDVKTPLFAAVNDRVELSVMLRNTTGAEIKSTVAVVLSGGFSDHLLPAQDVLVPANETKTVCFPIEAGRNAGKYNVQIEAVSGIYKDSVAREITIRDINFPYTYSFSGNDMLQTETFTLPNHIDGTLKAEAVAYISVLDELIDGVESIFRVPSGCFEQVSSSTFPNIFALQLLKATGQSRPGIVEKATGYLKMGYDKLAAYEVKGTGGFEWYGGSPAHEVLSAYGLVEFYEMAKVFDGVDKGKMERALSFILSRKNGSGGFNQNRGRYGFSSAPEHVNNAYIVYALAETGNTPGISEEYQAALNEALNSKDLYRMALLANAAHHMKDRASYDKLTGLFGAYAQNNDFRQISIQSTIVYSHGNAARLETVAFWLMALLKNEEAMNNLPLINKCVKYIISGRSYGSFGNSQATSICLQALTQYAQQMKAAFSGKDVFVVTINDELPAYMDVKEMFSRDENKLKVNFDDKLKTGRNTIKVEFTENSNPYPYSVNVSWQSATPPSAGLCPVKLTTKLESDIVKVNETVRLSVKLQNTKNEGLPMSIAVIGIPGGMSLQPWQLKELQEKEVFDFYEIINDNLVIYYRELGPAETKVVNLDLKAEIAGQYKGMASSAYQYYMNEFKYWIDGLSVTIEGSVSKGF